MKINFSNRPLITTAILWLVMFLVCWLGVSSLIMQAHYSSQYSQILPASKFFFDPVMLLQAFVVASAATLRRLTTIVAGRRLAF